jgi:hypothetical protein
VGEVASSNLVVPTINSIVFNKLGAQSWVHLAKMVLYVGSYKPKKPNTSANAASGIPTKEANNFAQVESLSATASEVSSSTSY